MTIDPITGAQQLLIITISYKSKLWQATNNTILTFDENALVFKNKVQQLLKPRKDLRALYIIMYHHDTESISTEIALVVHRNKDILLLLLLHTGRPLKIYHFTGLEKDTQYIDSCTTQTISDS